MHLWSGRHKIGSAMSLDLACFLSGKGGKLEFK